MIAASTCDSEVKHLRYQYIPAFSTIGPKMPFQPGNQLGAANKGHHRPRTSMCTQALISLLNEPAGDSDKARFIGFVNACTRMRSRATPWLSKRSWIALTAKRRNQSMFLKKARQPTTPLSYRA